MTVEHTFFDGSSRSTGTDCLYQTHFGLPYRSTSLQQKRPGMKRGYQRLHCLQPYDLAEVIRYDERARFISTKFYPDVYALEFEVTNTTTYTLQ